MEEDTVVALPRPGSGVMDDPLLAVLREGARQMLTQAIESEVAPGAPTRSITLFATIRAASCPVFVGLRASRTCTMTVSRVRVWSRGTSAQMHRHAYIRQSGHRWST